MLTRRWTEFVLLLFAVVAAAGAVVTAPPTRAEAAGVPAGYKCNFNTPWSCPTCYDFLSTGYSCRNARTNGTIYLCDLNGTTTCVAGGNIDCDMGRYYNASCQQTGMDIGGCSYTYPTC